MPISWNGGDTITANSLNQMQTLENFDYEPQFITNNISNMPSLVDYEKTENGKGTLKNLDIWLDSIIQDVENLKKWTRQISQDVYITDNGATMPNIQKPRYMLADNIGDYSLNDVENKGAVADYKTFNNKINNIINNTIPSANSTTENNIKTILKALYPEGKIIIMADNTNPNTNELESYGIYFIPYTDGENKFLLGTGENYTIGSNGGNSSTELTLTINNIPSHNHSIPPHKHTYQRNVKDTTAQAGSGNGAIKTLKQGGNVYTSQYPGGNTGNTGNESPVPVTVNIMPPYRVVKFWKVVDQNSYNLYLLEEAANSLQ